MRKSLSMLALSLLFTGGQNLFSDTTPPTAPQADEKSTPDWQLTLKVKTALLSDDSLSPSNRFVSISTTDGVVTITGEVSDKYQMNEIVKKAESVPGVVKVENKMTIGK